MMLFYTLLFALAIASALITVDYPASQMGLGWITIEMRSTTQVAVERVDWCKSGVPNAHEPPPPDIDGCHASNLQHLQLFPSAKPYLRDPPEAEPNMLYISADDLGGWDTRHQFDIIITGNKGAFKQLVRFNPLVSAPTTTATTEAPATVTEQEQPVLTSEAAVFKEPETQAPQTEVASEALTTPVITQGTEATSSTSTTEPEVATQPPAPPSHPWLGAGLFLGCGLTLIALVTLIIRWRAHRKANRHGRFASLAQVTAYQWNDMRISMLPPPGSEVEMVEFNAPSASDE